MLYSRRLTIAALATAGFAVTTGCFGANTASADIIDDIAPLLTSSCSFQQIDAAMHDVAPESAARLDSAPLQKALLQSMLAQPADKRAALFNQISTQRHRVSATTGLGLALPLKTQVGPIIQQVADWCHMY